MTSSTDQRDHYLTIAKGLHWLLSPSFTEKALQEAGHQFDTKPELGHPMSLDSEGRRQLRQI